MLTVKKSQQEFLKLLILFIAIALPWIFGGVYIYNTTQEGGQDPIKLVNFKMDTIPKVDHSQFRILQQEFVQPQEVTQACITCHNKTAQDVMQSSHWKWTKDYVTDSGETIQLGKKNIINNFCIGISSNEARCTSCHIGYGWENDDFDFTDGRNIDCLVCHDQTGTYKKFPSGAGFPASEEKVFEGKKYFPPDYKLIAQNVGTPKRQNCGTCHFEGGGGNNVKHGDIANEMNQVTRNVDVHMGVDGANMNCVDCHKTERHNISGNLYSISSTDKNRVTCEQCHTNSPHANKILNQHTNKVSCQTCHIPEFAKVSSTKMSWDWSTAGKLNADGSFIKEKDSLGNITYFSKKGTFVWGNNVQPEYYWFNGEAKHYVMGDKIDTTNAVQLNTLLGSYSDKMAKIVPVKRHVANQIYDPINNTMILPHLYGNDSTSYWKNFDWNEAARIGMESVGQPYSGEDDFIETEMYWPKNHMVAPREQSLQCIDCHTSDGRLENLNDFYLPGRDKNKLLDILGIAMLILSFTGVLIHASLRILKNT